MSFEKIINHDQPIQILKRELKTGEVSHAYLFLGKKGVGKKTLALEFAKSLFCQQKKLDNCNNCISCKKINHHNHPDVKLITSEEDTSKIKIDQIREIQKEIAYKPYESENKIYIIDEADNMTLQAANSLLKTLEEPPSYGILILLAEELNALLPTIISRCEKIKLSNISRKKIINYLLENEELSEEEAQIYAVFGQGSLGRALEFVENEDAIQERKKVLEFLAGFPEISRVEIFNKVKELEEIMTADFPFFNLISGWYRDIILYMKGNHSQLINYDYKEEIKQQASEYTICELTSIINLIEKYENYIESNCREKLTLQVLFLKLRSKRV